jgi:hypothetical protein
MKYLKLFEQFDHRFLESRINTLKKPYVKQGMEIELYPRYGNSMYLSMIRTPDNLKGKGLAKQFMKDMCDFADEYRLIITLSPTDRFGSNLERLKEFYYSFSFKPNKDKNYAVSMIRYPMIDISHYTERSATS